MKYKIDVN